MEKQLKDYLHLYLGCEVIFKDEVYQLSAITDNGSTVGIGFEKTFLLRHAYDVKLLLRKVTSITDAEALDFGYPNASFIVSVWNEMNVANNYGFRPSIFVKLLSLHFDLFDLIEAGLAIDKTTLP